MTLKQVLLYSIMVSCFLVRNYFLLFEVIMPLVEKINHIYEPNPLACGQAVLAMLSGVDVYEIIRLVNTEKETTLKDMKTALTKLEISYKNERVEVKSKNELPRVAVLSLETPKCWHWSLYFDEKFYDPEYGVLEDFPPSCRRYFWEILP